MLGMMTGGWIDIELQSRRLGLDAMWFNDHLLILYLSYYLSLSHIGLRRVG